MCECECVLKFIANRSFVVNLCLASHDLKLGSFNSKSHGHFKTWSFHNMLFSC